MQQAKRLLWRALDCLLVWAAQVVRIPWRIILTLLALNSRTAMLAVYLITGAQILFLWLGDGAETASPGMSQILIFLLGALLLHFLFDAIQAAGNRVALAFWRWRAARILPRL